MTVEEYLDLALELAKVISKDELFAKEFSECAELLISEHGEYNAKCVVIQVLGDELRHAYHLGRFIDNDSDGIAITGRSEVVELLIISYSLSKLNSNLESTIENCNPTEINQPTIH